MPLAFVLCLFSPPSTADTKFPFLSQQREWKEGKPAGRPKGWAGKLLSSAAQAPVPSQGQVPACPRSPAASHSQPLLPPPGEGQDSPALGRQAAGGGGKPGSPPATWHVGATRVTVWELALSSRGALGQDGGSGAGSCSDHSIPVPPPFPPYSESPGPTPCTSGWPFRERPRIPLPRLRYQHLEAGESRDKGTWDPFPAAGSPSQPEQARSRCAFQMHCSPPVCSCSSLPTLCFFQGKERDGRRERARSESDQGTDAHKQANIS